MKNEKKNLTIVGQYSERLTWFPIWQSHTRVIKGLAYSEIKSKGLAQIFLEKTGKEAIEGSLTSYNEIQYPKKNDIEKD